MNKLKLILFTLLFCFSCSFCNAQYLSELKVKRNIQDTVKSIQTLTEKSLFLAGTFSFVVPGFALGQIYNGQLNKFIIHAGISAGCILLTYLGFEFEFIKVGINKKGKNEGLFVSVFLLYLGNWIWSIVDAVNSAGEINKTIRHQKNHSHIFDKMNFGLTVNKNKRLNLKFALEL